MYIVVGLGNPGDKYEKTRHNVGFNVIDLLAKEYSIDVSKLKHKALIGEGRVGTEKVILVKPMTYMNLSGESVVDICNYYNVDLENVIVIYDDIDLDVGKIRIRKKGGPGTHNGMKSVVHEILSDEFIRIRVGIGSPNDKSEMIEYVIGKLEDEEYNKLTMGIDKAEEAVVEILKNGIDKSMNKFNGENATNKE